MPSNKQRREVTRRNLERQLQERQDREHRRKKATLVTSIVGTIAAMVIIAVVIVLAVNDSNDNNQAGGPSSAAPTTQATSAPASTPAPTPTPSSSHARPAKGKTVTFKGVAVRGAKDLGGEPGVTSKSTSVPTALQYKDLVVGKGAPAAATSTVEVQYTGVVYANGSEFDSSWARGSAADFPLNQVIPGFTQGIGGDGKNIPPMRIGGRRIMILPGALAYGAQPPPGSNIPKNAALVFVVDLKKVSG